MSKVIEFPKDRIKNIPSNFNEGIDQLYVKKKGFVDNLVQSYATLLFHKLTLHGFDTNNETFIYDYAFTVESLRSALYRDLGIEHPFQELSDNTKENIDEGTMSLDDMMDTELDLEIDELMDDDSEN